MTNLIAIVENFWVALQTGHLPHLGMWNYILLVFLVIIEGPIATVLAAAAAAAGYLNIKVVLVVAGFSNLLADLLWYSVGYAGKIEWALRLGRPFGLRRQHLFQAQQDFAEQAPRLLILAKLTSAFTVPMLMAAGLAKLSFRRWLPGYIVAEAVWTGALVVLGYHATETLTNLDRNMESAGLALMAVFVIAAILIYRRTLQNRQAAAITPTTDPDA